MRNVPRKSRRWRRALLARARRLQHAETLVRAQIVALATGGRSAREITETLGCVRSHVYTTTGRFVQEGWEALMDRRRSNGMRKADEAFHWAVKQLLDQCPRDFSYLRPTWTRELLVIVAEEQTGVHVSLAVMGRVLRRLRARRGRPKPAVQCPLSERQQRRRLQNIRDLIQGLPADEVAVYEDEVDVHLNPKIGLDWMNHGHQRIVMTPGKNEKAYLAGTLDAQDGTILWVGDVVKNSSLFVAMLRKLDEHYARARRIHVIADNYGIHKSQEVWAALKEMPRIWLHFLPPYSPDHNRIERVWLDLHANVTRNHRHTNLIALCQDVVSFLEAASPWVPGRRPALLKVA